MLVWIHGDALKLNISKGAPKLSMNSTMAGALSGRGFEWEGIG